eukprot:7729290-Alexandrium_andersonii.AAC.1
MGSAPRQLAAAPLSHPQGRRRQLLQAPQRRLRREIRAVRAHRVVPGEGSPPGEARPRVPQGAVGRQ